MTVATIPLATHVKAVHRSLDDIHALARGAYNQKPVLERLAQARQSPEAVASALSQSADS